MGGGKRSSSLMSGPSWSPSTNETRQPQRKAAEARPGDEASTHYEATTPPIVVSGALPKETRVPMRRLGSFPTWVDRELVRACLEASYRIRHERQVAYERTVVLESPGAELTLLPIKGTGVGLRVPFRVRRTGSALRGELLLGPAGEWMPAMVEADAERELAIRGWACALLGFAAVTCFEAEPFEPSSPQGHSISSRSSSPRGSDRRLQPRTVPRRRAWPAYVEPIGEWVRYRGSFVSGHRRRLFGRAPSAKARQRAEEVGIVLRPNETWVQAHTRGIPEDMEMRFTWRAPEALRAL